MRNRFFARNSSAFVLLTVTSIVAFGSRAAAQDFNLNPTFGSVNLKADFLPDPFVKDLVAGGQIKTTLGGVNAYVAKAPDFRLNYTAGTYILTIHVESKADTTLLINLPDGTWIADDDTGGNLNPLIRFQKPQSGQYDIYVGTYGKDYAQATLKITERTVQPANVQVATNQSPKNQGPKKDKAQEDVERQWYHALELEKGGRIAESAGIYQKILPEGERIYGKDGTNTATILNNLALCYREMGQYAKAEPFYQRSLQIREARLGKDHADAVQSLNSLAYLYRTMGQYAKAESLSLRNLRNNEAKYGMNNLAVAGSLANLGHAYLGMGEYAKAETHYLRCLQIREGLEKNSANAALALNDLGNLYRETGDYPKAETHYLRCVQIREGLDNNNTAVAFPLNDLARLYEFMGRFSQAEEVCQRGMEIREIKLGRNHPEVAQSLSTLANLYLTSGQYYKAEPLYQRAVQIREDKHGADHIYTATALNNLSALYAEMGQYSKAEPLIQRSLEIREAALGKDHPDVAMALNSLGDLYRVMGQSAKAEPFYRRSLAIREAKFGKDHPIVAASLNNLALVHAARRQHAKAEALYLRSLEIREAKFGKDHSSAHDTLNNLAQLYISLGQYDKAGPLCERSLKLKQARYGTTHPTIAQGQLTRATIAWAKKEPDRAIDLVQQAVEIYRARLGKNHPRTDHAMTRLASYLDQTDRLAEAVRTMDQSLRGLRIHAARVLPILPESEQMGFMVNSFENDFLTAVSLGLNPKISEDNRLRSAGWVLNGKSIIHQSLAERLLLARENQSIDAKGILAELEETRRQMARLNLQKASASETAHFRKEIEAMRDKEKSLESRLYSRGSANRPDPWVEIDDLRQKLSANTAYVDFLRFTPNNISASGPVKAKNLAPIYVAWITSRDRETAIVNLGSADEIDAAIQTARQELQQANVRIRKEGERDAEKLAREKLTAVTKLVLAPLLPHLARYPHWILGPDGNLWLIPWACLPLDDEKYVLENHTLRYVTSGRDLVLNVLQLDHRGTTPVIFADPDFDREPNLDAGAAYRSLGGKKLTGQIDAWNVAFEFTTAGKVVIRDQDGGAVAGEGSWNVQGDQLIVQTKSFRFEGSLQDDKIAGQRIPAKSDGKNGRSPWHLRLPETSWLRSQGAAAPRQLNRVSRLPGTAAEAGAITPALAKWAGTLPRCLTDNDATVGAFQRLKGPKVLVLSTHGYFQPDQKVPEHLRNRTEDPETRVFSGGFENPLLRSGLLLAGCNHSAASRVGQETGILTGLEIVGTDLRGTELVVLSACETGLGDVRNGEGVAGLRQAFQLAGAQTVVASLWKIPDRETALLMKTFFEKMAAGQNKVDALRNAQLTMLRDRREQNAAAHPFYWGAFTVTGR